MSKPEQKRKADYALREYGATQKEVARAERRAMAEMNAARKRGEMVTFTGKIKL